ncbi:HNH endonuclease signature motif containing protein [Kitasatospora sp. NPDC006786]|uniref:HNH endonuclease n=1 Tax=unclassified Kitasatospora TaxID=2633591 RepID=UPI0033E14F72
MSALAGDGFKYCSGCRSAKPLDEFHRSASHPDGHLSQCKVCRVAKETDRYHASDKAAATRARMERIRELDAASMRACTSCLEVKSHTEFCRNPRQREGISTICTPCVNEYTREWARLNPGKTAEYRKRWESKPGAKEMLAAKRARFRANNPDYGRLKAAQRRAMERGSTAEPVSQRQIRRLVSELGVKCFYCDGPFEHLDHFIPISKGGPHSIDNLVPSCADCNLHKSDKMPWDWIPDLGAR